MKDMKMTKATTAVMFAGPKSIGSFGDEDGWRVGLVCQIVDGGFNGPFLLCNMPEQPERVVQWQGLSVDDGVHALLIALGIFYGDGYVQGLLLDSHNIENHNGELRVAPYFEIAPEIEKLLTEKIKSIVKIGIFKLSPDSSLQDEMVSKLIRAGISVERFSRLPD